MSQQAHFTGLRDGGPYSNTSFLIRTSICSTLCLEVGKVWVVNHLTVTFHARSDCMVTSFASSTV